MVKKGKKSIYGKGAIAKLPDEGVKQVISWRAQGKSVREISELIQVEFGEEVSHTAVSGFLKKWKDNRTGVVAQSNILQKQQANEYFDIVRVFKQTNDRSMALMDQIEHLFNEAKAKLATGEASWSEVNGLIKTQIQLFDSVAKQIKLNAQLAGKMEAKTKIDTVNQINVYDLAPKIGMAIEGMLAKGGLYCAKCKSTHVKYKELKPEEVIDL